MSKLSELVEETKKLKEKMQKDGEEALKSSFKEFFATHPEATSIVWCQYTPYFNDGDACTFGVHEMELRVDPDQMQEDIRGELSDQQDDSYSYGDNNAVRVLSNIQDTPDNQRYTRSKVPLRELTPSEESLINDFDELQDACNQIPDVLEMVFGDHAHIVATDEGFEVTEQSHD